MANANAFTDSLFRLDYMDVKISKSKKKNEKWKTKRADNILRYFFLLWATLIGKYCLTTI